MKEHGITLIGPMVRAVLDDRKTHTRRIIKPEWWRCLDPEDEEDHQKALAQCPYGQIGDHLWVRETLRRCQDSEGSIPLALYDVGRVPVSRDSAPAEWHWKNSVLPSRFMPRWASRITLEITNLRVERVRDISDEDAIAEGVEVATAPDGRTYMLTDDKPMWLGYGGALPCVSARDSFRTLWDSINAKRGHSWESNPWVWVVEFRKL